MLQKIELENYRCFKKTSIDFKNKDNVVIVGKNNAGKSTIIEALRLVSMACQKASRAIYIPPPTLLDIPAINRGFSLDITKLKIDLLGVIYKYEIDTVAKIKAYFKNNTKIEILINNNIVFVVIFDDNGNVITKKSFADRYNFDIFKIMPPLSNLKEIENSLLRDTIVNNVYNYLSSSHFRNEVYLFSNEYFDHFKDIAEKSWSGLRIEKPFIDYEEEKIKMIITDNDFAAEIGQMGSGLQMWIQIMWFIAKSNSEDIIVLDEPDVYMHPDLQLKLIRLLQNKCKQLIVATHSTEIISNIDPKNILNIDKSLSRQVYANKSAAVQSIIENMGAVYNLSLIRLGYSKRCLFVEGKDLKILKTLYSKIFPDEENIFETMPVIQIGGFANLPYTFGASDLLFSETTGNIKCYCILDRDYYSDDVYESKNNEAVLHHLDLIFLERKEIENYLISPKMLYRLSRTKESYEQFISDFETTVIDPYKSEVIYKVQDKLFELNRKLQPSQHHQRAEQIVNAKWNNLENKIDLIPGKEAIHKINDYLREKYNANTSMSLYLGSIRSEEISTNLKDIFNELKR